MTDETNRPAPTDEEILDALREAAERTRCRLTCPHGDRCWRREGHDGECSRPCGCARDAGEAPTDVGAWIKSWPKWEQDYAIRILREAGKPWKP